MTERMFAQFTENGEFVPGTIVSSAIELGKNGVPMSQMGRVLVRIEDDVFLSFTRACGFCWAPVVDSLECDRHRGSQPKSLDPMPVKFRDIWAQQQTERRGSRRSR